MNPDLAFLPRAGDLPATLALTRPIVLDDLLQKSLLAPVADFLGRPSKRFRARLVELGARLSLLGEDADAWTPELSRTCEAASRIVESLHAGALIVDDIQDRSRVRRGAPTLHLKYGVPVALNAGNWLYFWALDQVRSLGVSPKIELEIHRACVRILSRAHFGQALDIGTPIDEVEQQRVPEICQASMELKTGTLLALSMRLGAILASASAERIEELDALGNRLGVALQIFDDIGSFAQSVGPEGMANPKRFEDLYLRRPTGVWAFAAKRYESRDYGQLVDAVRRLPNESFLTAWIEIHHFLPEAKQWAVSELCGAIAEFQERYGDTHPQCVGGLRALGAEMEKAYG